VGITTYVPDENGILLDWATASVVDSTLSVGFTAKPPKKWSDRYEEVVERLQRGGSGWGEVELVKKALRVAEVTPGAEAGLRHLLESAAQQANADVAVEDDSKPEQDRSEADERMTETFRSFADGGG
jgi:hypothetical protein